MHIHVQTVNIHALSITACIYSLNICDSLHSTLHSICCVLHSWFILYAMQPRMSVATPRTQDDDDCSDLLQSLRFDAAKHSSHGYRCSNRYEWYQTSSDVYIDIMIPNVKKDDIIVRFTDTKVLYKNIHINC